MKLNPNDCYIGKYYQSANTLYSLTGIITSEGKNSVFLGPLDGGEVIGTIVENVAPIELNIEWLEKLGFELDTKFASVIYKYRFEEIFDFGVEVRSTKEGKSFEIIWWDAIEDLKIMYVHQLQALFYEFTKVNLHLKEFVKAATF